MILKRAVRAHQGAVVRSLLRFLGTFGYMFLLLIDGCRGVECMVSNRRSHSIPLLSPYSTSETSSFLHSLAPFRFLSRLLLRSPVCLRTLDELILPFSFERPTKPIKAHRPSYDPFPRNPPETAFPGWNLQQAFSPHRLPYLTQHRLLSSQAFRFR